MNHTKTHMTICKNCNSKFKTNRKSAIYCSDNCRVQAFRAREQQCWYCGDLATSRDHVIPHSLTGDKVRQWTGVDIVPCCISCNSTLGAQLFDRMADRLAYLARKLCERHNFNKPHVTWTEDDLAELTGNLRQYVKAKEFEFAAQRSRYLHVLLRQMQLEDIEQ